MTIQLADPAHSRIVLIGTPTHVRADERLPDVPVVANNLTDLAAVFTDPELGGFDAQHCVTAPPDAGMPDLGKLLTDAAEQAKDLLLIYYAGHGLLDRRGQLHLALAGTHPDRLGFTALPFETLRHVCLDSPATSRVVILDSCYSGRAIGQPLSGADQEILEQLQARGTRGTYTLTSAPANRTAQILAGERHTAFTGRLLDLLRDGHPEVGEVFSMGEIYRRLHTRLTADGLPAPQQRGTDTADLLGLVRNRRPAPPPIAPLPEEIREALDSRLPELRLATVKVLGEWLKLADKAQVRAAVTALQYVADHDNPTVAGAARGLLGGAEVTVVSAKPSAVSISRVAQSAPATTKSVANPDPDWVNQVRRLAGEAERRAKRVSLEGGRGPMADVARAWAIVDPEKARGLLVSEVEAHADSVKDDTKRLRLLVDVTRAWAKIDSDEARRTAAEAEQIAVAIKQDEMGVTLALAEAVRGWAAVDSAEAERVAKTIKVDYARAKALVEVTGGWATTIPGEALRIAMTISDGEYRAHALAEVARKWGPTDPGMAKLAVAEAERIVTTSHVGGIRARNLARIAIGWAAIDQIKGRQLVTEAQTMAITTEDHFFRTEALFSVVLGWSVIDPAAAEEVATLITNEPLRQIQALAAVARGWATVDLAKAAKVAKSIVLSSYQARALAEIALAYGEKAKLGNLPM